MHLEPPHSKSIPGNEVTAVPSAVATLIFLAATGKTPLVYTQRTFFQIHSFKPGLAESSPLLAEELIDSSTGYIQDSGLVFFHVGNPYYPNQQWPKFELDFKNLGVKVVQWVRNNG